MTDKPVSERVSIEELRKAAHELCAACGGDLKVLYSGHRLPCLNAWHVKIDALADRLEEAYATIDLLECEVKAAETRSGMDNVIQQLESQRDVEREARKKTEREVESRDKMLARIINWIDGRTLGYPHGDLKELHDFIAALRGDKK